MSPKLARIIATHGRHYLAWADGALFHSVTRGRKSDIAVGDDVLLRVTAPGQGVIETCHPRRTLLFRSDRYRVKLLAANVTQLFVLVAAEPTLSDDFLSRALIASEAAHIPARIILNKTDLAEKQAVARQRLQTYVRLGYLVCPVSVTENPKQAHEVLLPLIQGQTTLLIGQSGVGKSSLINMILPSADIATRAISSSLNMGRHTTTFTRLYALDEQTALIDSPGFHEFGLYHLDRHALEQAFREFRPGLGHCRFQDCRHDTEPDCAILAACDRGEIDPARHKLYGQLCRESAHNR
ncbi:MAG: ribosome small subunit-dependent GTPase A [Burkholderiaceae bacterium]|jgi:ribosome biogenesis GTPase|nr:ribosome small subunit-dependent GTPase A [Burkholderiaceae bacterium]